MNEVSDREKAIFDKHRKNMLTDILETSKEMNATLSKAKTNGPLENIEYAIYENYDPNSKQNQLVRRIQENDVLDENEKESLMKGHEGNMRDIEMAMETEKKSQDQEMDRALRERMERRRRLKEKLNKKAITKGQREAEKLVETEINEKRAMEMATIQNEHERKMNILKETDKDDTHHVKELNKETEAIKRAALDKIGEERDGLVDKRKQEVFDEFTKGAQNDEEIRAQLRKLLGNENDNYDALILNADREKQKQEQALQEKLRNKAKTHEEALKVDSAKFEKE